MATGQLTSVIDHLRRTAGGHNVSGRTDGELLSAFLARHDAAAFEALVRRHGPMVHGVCRRVLANRVDVEDAFQATFLVLVRRAHTVRPREKVGNWLYGVAYKTALAAKRTLARRHARETQVSAMPHPATDSDQARLDLQQLLDQELSQLPEKYRLPVVLCDLEGRTRREVARQLRLPEGTLSNRLTAGRQRLAGRLKRRGLTLSAGAVATLLGREASAHVPAALISSTVATALQVAATPAALATLLPTPVGSLTQGVLQTMWLAKLKVTVALVLTLGVLGAGTAWTWPAAQDPTPAPTAAKAPPSGDAAKKARARSQEILRDALKAFNAAADEPATMRHRLLADMAALQGRLGDRPAARKLFAQARELLAALPAEYDRDGQLRVLATAEARAGDVDAALTTTRRLPEGEKLRDITLQEVATELAKDRREKDALRVGALIGDAPTRAWVLSMLLEQVALAHAKAGDFAQALGVVERMKEPASQVNALCGVVYGNLWYVDYPNEPGVALLLAEAGDKGGARKALRQAAALAATVTDKDQKERTLAALACAQARFGELAAARKTAEGIVHKDWKLIALATVARNLARAGQAKEALAVADQQPTDLAKMFVLLHVGGGQIKAGDRKGAREAFRQAELLLGQLENQDRGSGYQHSVASAWAEVGDYTKAVDSSGALLPEANGPYVSSVYIRAQSGDFAGALKMTELLNASDVWKGDLLRWIAKLQAERGREKAALEWAGRLDAPLDRAYALLGVAEGLVTAKR
jgi:RNA polymerase sigma factor (sigma-70 family)